MNIIITSGGTSEQIDGVRKITNMSTGKLGLTIFEKLSSIENVNIYFITSSHCLKPSEGNVIIANSAEEVKEELFSLLKKIKVDYVIHAMAVSDYKTKSVFDIDKTIDLLSNELVNKDEKEIKILLKKYLIEEPISLDRNKKLSSNNDNMLLLLDKNVKIINSIKSISPQTKLVGFKLLNKCSFTELEIAANKVIQNSKADYVIANDLSNIIGDKHESFIFSNELDFVKRLENKNDIANFLYNLIK